MRSADAASLQALDAKFNKAVDDAVRDENARWKQAGADGGQGAGRQSPGGPDAERLRPIVQAAVSVTKALGFPVTLDEGSTDSNYPMSLGIPAITIDGGGRGTDAHALDESFDRPTRGRARSARCCWRSRCAAVGSSPKPQAPSPKPQDPD